MRDVIERFSVVNARLIGSWKHVKFKADGSTTGRIYRAVCGGCSVRGPRGDDGGKHDGFDVIVVHLGREEMMVVDCDALEMHGHEVEGTWCQMRLFCTIPT